MNRPTTVHSMPQERLQKILSRAGIASRRHAEQIIQAGKVTVNGKILRELGTKADPGKDDIRVEGRPIRWSHQHHYYAYHKPAGVVVSKRDELGRATLFDGLKLPANVNAVGRLDKDSEGLLLLSDDGEFIQRYTHPSFGISKVYHVRISRPLKREEMQRMKTGMILGGKTARAVRVKNLKDQAGYWIEMELREGMKREIRRMLEQFEIGVYQLIRVQHGSVKLGNLAPGRLKKLEKRPG